MIKRIMVLLGLVVLLVPGAVQAGNQVDWNYSLTHISGNQYSYTFDFMNQGPENDAIFKIVINNIPSTWSTVSFDTLTDWESSKNGNHLNLQTDNGSLNITPEKGQDRIWGNSGAPYGPGVTSGIFVWTFNTTSSLLPTSNHFSDSDVVVHLQQIGSTWQNYGSSYTVTPHTAVPEPGSLATMLCGLSGLGGLMWRKRK